MDFGFLLIVGIIAFAIPMLLQNSNDDSSRNQMAGQVDKKEINSYNVKKFENANIYTAENINSTSKNRDFDDYDEDVAMSKFPFNGTLHVIIEDISLKNSKPLFDSGRLLFSDLPKWRPHLDYGYYFDLTVRSLEVETRLRISQNIFLNVEPDFLVQMTQCIDPLWSFLDNKDLDPFIQLFYSIVDEKNRDDLRHAINMIENDIPIEKVEPIIKKYLALLPF